MVLGCHTGKMLAEASIRHVLQAKQPFWLLSINVFPVGQLYKFILCFRTVSYKLHYVWMFKPHEMTGFVLILLILKS